MPRYFVLCVSVCLRARNDRNEWAPQQVSFRAGPVIVARQVDAASPRPFELPTTIDGETLAGATPLNSALIVTGFTEVDPEVTGPGPSLGPGIIV